LCVFSIVAVSRGDTKSIPPGLTVNNTFEFEKVSRSYDLFVPPSLPDKPVPLVILMHGYSGDAAELNGTSSTQNTSPFKPWLSVAEKEHFICLYPEGVKNEIGKRPWNDCRGVKENGTNNDVGFISALIDFISKDHKIDQKRIYASGFSNGGHMSIRLALELSDKIAAIAPIAAAMSAKGPCGKPIKPVSVLFMNGTRDPFLPFKGGKMIAGRGEVLSAADSVKLWVDFLKTDIKPVVEEKPDINIEDGSKVKIETYKNGINGTEVVLYTIDGGGHSIPSIAERYNRNIFYVPKIFRQNYDIESAVEVWNFFKRQKRR
jgi:polyhydroxybutyrate depolymerase